MTEQFSREYIEYILSDEAKPLQEKWNPGVGDWVWNGMELGIMQGTFNWNDLVGVFRQHHWETGKWSPETFGREQLTWLPTLWDLVGIIEGKWPTVRMCKYELSDGSRHYWFKGIPQVGYSEDSPTETDVMLAAAKLAVWGLKKAMSESLE